MTDLISFDKTTHEEALALSIDRDPWVVPGLIASTSTLVVGESKIGKSYLLSALIAGLTVHGTFLNRPVVDNGVGYSVAVGWTDDGGDQEYASRIDTVMPPEEVPTVEYYRLPVMRTLDHWEGLFSQVVADGHNFLVIDNMSQAADGDLNNGQPVRDFFEGVRLFTHAGIPVVVLHHASDSVGANGGKSDRPMGHHTITASVRHRITLRYAKKGNLILKSLGNIDHPFSMTLKPLAGARYEVVAEENVTEAWEAAEERARVQEEQTKDRHREIARWIADHGKGGPAEVARQVERDCPVRTPDGEPYKQGTVKEWLKPGNPLRVMVDWNKSDDTWSMTGE